jgi:hypothetical protein
MPNDTPGDTLIRVRAILVQHRRSLAVNLLAGKPRTGGGPPHREDFVDTQQLIQAIDQAIKDERELETARREKRETT